MFDVDSLVCACLLQRKQLIIRAERDGNIYVLICFPVCVVFAKSSSAVTVEYTLNFSVCARMIPQILCVVVLYKVIRCTIFSIKEFKKSQNALSTT